MIKHIITLDCPRSCSYCINRNLSVKEYSGRFYKSLTNRIYYILSQCHDSIMITGGEPTLSDKFSISIILAKRYFKKVFLTTQNNIMLLWKDADDWFDAITFSIHDYNWRERKVKINTPVYASIMTHLYTNDLPLRLKGLGFSGLTINENHFGAETFDETIIPRLEGFSIKINRRGNCIDDGTIFIMPDLSIKPSFKEYL